MTEEHYIKKVGGYMAEVRRHISGIRSDALFGTSGYKMRVVIPAAHGEVSVCLQFYQCTVRVVAVHSLSVDPSLESRVRKALKALNAATDGTYGYGIRGETRELTFSACYDLRKRDATADAGLHGFCELIGRTAVEKLDALAGEKTLNEQGIRP